MVLTTVVTNRFFEKLYPILRELDSDRRTGPLVLAMLVPYSGDEYRSLVLSSVALDAMGLGAATSLVLSKLRSELREESFKIDSVSILRTHESAVRMLCESYDVPEIGTAYQAMGMPTLLLNLDDPILFVTRPLPVSVAA